MAKEAKMGLGAGQYELMNKRRMRLGRAGSMCWRYQEKGTSENFNLRQVPRSRDNWTRSQNPIMCSRAILTMEAISAILSFLSLFFIISDHLQTIIPLIFILQMHMTNTVQNEQQSNPPQEGEWSPVGFKVLICKMRTLHYIVSSTSYLICLNFNFFIKYKW